MRDFGPALVLTLLPVSIASVSAENCRDLTKASPESVGISSEHLKRLEMGMQRFVDGNRLAGVTSSPCRWMAMRELMPHSSGLGYLLNQALVN